MRTLTVLAGLCIGTLGAAAAQESFLRFTAEGVRAHVEFLADDLLEGRGTATRGHEIAARYVASQLAAYGLEPGGTQGWYQPVTFQRTAMVPRSGVVSISGSGGEQRWLHGTEVIVGMSPRDADIDVTAALVFVGYGIENPLLGIDDYRGLDVKGKIVVVLSGFPKGLPSEEGAHVGSTKSLTAERHGAIGIIGIDTAQSAKTFPWKMRLQYVDDPDFDWVGPDGRVHMEAPAVKARTSTNAPVAEAIFAGAPRKLSAVLAEAARVRGAPKGFALETRGRIQSRSTSERVTSPNVIGVLPGADPALANQYVVLSAHLDHLGISPARNDDKPGTDRINNGALDNAAGVAVMLEVARAAASAPDRPRRSIIFIATTAEENGLLGADYFARHPTVPIRQIVGNVDLDMPVLLYPFTDVVAYGADHSTFGQLIAAAAATMNIQLGPDPMPAEGIFTRSDHYMFVKQGVPAVMLATGFANGGAKAWEEFLANTYHQPGDDMQQKIDWQVGARYAEVNYRVTRAMADADEAPRWYAKDFFGDTFAAGAPRAPAPKSAPQPAQNK